MSSFHSIVSRRDFMKALGVTGAGLGAAAAVAPSFNDIDDMMGAPSASNHLPWYVKEMDLLKCTSEIDWDMLKRWDHSNTGYGAATTKHYPSGARNAEYTAAGNARRDEYRAKQHPGYDLKWQALNQGKSDRKTSAAWQYEGLTNTADLSPLPSEWGLPNWTGTPEEASRLAMAAIRYFGFSIVGFADLDSTWRNKLVLTKTSATAAYVYDNVPKAFRRTNGTITEHVIPSKASLLFLCSPQTPEARKSNSILANGNATAVDNFHSSVEARLFRFLRTLGDYQLFGLTGHQAFAVNAGAATALTGVGEASRQNNYALSFEVGPNYNPLVLMTTLPLAPTKPIDAGMFRFCHGCAICAKQCPSNSISLDKEPSWDIPLTEGLPTIYKNPGIKLFWTNQVSCYNYYTQYYGCAPVEIMGDAGGGRSCFGVCPFGEDRAALAHNVIRATAATTGIFNSFFASLADVFGTGQAALRPDDWWDMALPSHGTPTHIRATKGQWKM
ncbi:reductive dehalogenase [Dehalogenimonas sp. THU2]|uniref:reductive dehalogenase n=1 Tax=Dehalogenimonas sp. THU2 TaxID=3151121 RepID=UPI003218B95D